MTPPLLRKARCSLCRHSRTLRVAGSSSSDASCSFPECASLSASASASASAAAPASVAAVAFSLSPVFEASEADPALCLSSRPSTSSSASFASSDSCSLARARLVLDARREVFALAVRFLEPAFVERLAPYFFPCLSLSLSSSSMSSSALSLSSSSVSYTHL